MRRFLQDMYKTLNVLPLLFVVLSCTEKSEIEISLTGEIRGRLFFYDEFGHRLNSEGQVEVQLEGGKPLITTVSDEEGRFNLSNVPTGTYNIHMHKEGFGIMPVYGLKIIGGEEPLYIGSYAVERSRTFLSNISTSWEGNLLRVKGTIHYNQSSLYDAGAMVTFLNKGPVVRSDEYMMYDIFTFNFSEDTEVDFSIFCDPAIFPGGSTISLKIYGASIFFPFHHIPGTDTVIFPTLSETSSETITINVP